MQVGVQRDAGMLLGPKFVALQNTLFGWLQDPTNLVFIKLLDLRAMLMRLSRKISARGGNEGESEGEDSESGDDLDVETLMLKESAVHGTKRKVRRVTVPASWKGGWTALGQFFLPTITQEPTAKLLLLLYTERDSTASSTGAINFTDGNAPERIRLKIYEDVPFAATKSFLPGGVSQPFPSTKKKDYTFCHRLHRASGLLLACMSLRALFLDLRQHELKKRRLFRLLSFFR